MRLTSAAVVEEEEEEEESLSSVIAETSRRFFLHASAAGSSGLTRPTETASKLMPSPNFSAKIFSARLTASSREAGAKYKSFRKSPPEFETAAWAKPARRSASTSAAGRAP